MGNANHVAVDGESRCARRVVPRDCKPERVQDLQGIRFSFRRSDIFYASKNPVFAIPVHLGPLKMAHSHSQRLLKLLLAFFCMLLSLCHAAPLADQDSNTVSVFNLSSALTITSKQNASLVAGNSIYYRVPGSPAAILYDVPLGPRLADYAVDLVLSKAKNTLRRRLASEGGDARCR